MGYEHHDSQGGCVHSVSNTPNRGEFYPTHPLNYDPMNYDYSMNPQHNYQYHYYKKNAFINPPTLCYPESLTTLYYPMEISNNNYNSQQLRQYHHNQQHNKQFISHDNHDLSFTFDVNNHDHLHHYKSNH